MKLEFIQIKKSANRTMEKKYFSSLSQIEKIDFIWNYGEVLHEIETPESYNSLFVLHDFFIEVKLDKFSNEIAPILVVEDRHQLLKYLETIDLNLIQAE